MATIAKKPKKDSGDFWRDVENALCSRDLGEIGEMEQRGEGYERLAGFNLARLVQGILIKHGFQPFEVDMLALARYLTKYVAAHCENVDADTTIEYMVYSWGKIVSPEGCDPVWYAGQKALAAKQPAPGEYPTKRQTEKAKLVWHLLCALPEEKDGCVYVTYRKIGEALKMDKDTVMLVLDALVRNKVIVKAREGRQGMATRYRILQNTDR